MQPNDVSKKSLKVLDKKLEWLSEHADFDVTINSVLGSDIRQPEDAFQVAKRARDLRFNSTVGILHDGGGQLRALSGTQASVHERILGLATGLFSFAHLDAFQRNTVRGLSNGWHCPAGGRFLYICEDGLVHYCSQQRGHPAIPLERYSREDLIREGAPNRKAARPFAQFRASTKPPCSTTFAPARARRWLVFSHAGKNAIQVGKRRHRCARCNGCSFVIRASGTSSARRQCASSACARLQSTKSRRLFDAFVAIARDDESR